MPSVPLVYRLAEKPLRDRQQCSLPKEGLRDIGYKGYRETRSRLNRLDPSFCMRDAYWEVNGKPLCTQHAGILVIKRICRGTKP